MTATTRPSVERQHGYYWVRHPDLESRWAPALWGCNDWEILGITTVGWRDAELIEIGEPIPLPLTKVTAA